MTETERKALALVNEVEPLPHTYDRQSLFQSRPFKALCRAIEQHEAFRQEVSDAVVGHCVWKDVGVPEDFHRFIIAKPDNIAAGLALAVEDTLELVVGDEDVNRLRAALAARGLEIREVGHD